MSRAVTNEQLQKYKAICSGKLYDPDCEIQEDEWGLILMLIADLEEARGLLTVFVDGFHKDVDLALAQAYIDGRK